MADFSPAFPLSQRPGQQFSMQQRAAMPQMQGQSLPLVQAIKQGDARPVWNRFADGEAGRMAPLPTPAQQQPSAQQQTPMWQAWGGNGANTFLGAFGALRGQWPAAFGQDLNTQPMVDPRVPKPMGWNPFGRR